MGTDIYTWATLLLAPLTGIISWIAGRRKRDQELKASESEALTKLQATIDLLAERNKALYEEVQELRRQVANLQLELDLTRHPNQ